MLAMLGSIPTGRLRWRCCHPVPITPPLPLLLLSAWWSAL
jgi:hypothetical protein